MLFFLRFSFFLLFMLLGQKSEPEFTVLLICDFRAFWRNPIRERSGNWFGYFFREFWRGILEGVWYYLGVGSGRFPWENKSKDKSRKTIQKQIGKHRKIASKFPNTWFNDVRPGNPVLGRISRRIRIWGHKNPNSSPRGQKIGKTNLKTKYAFTFV